MSRASRIPNLGGARAFVLHRPHATVQAMTAAALGDRPRGGRLLAGAAGRGARRRLRVLRRRPRLRRAVPLEARRGADADGRADRVGGAGAHRMGAAQMPTRSC